MTSTVPPRILMLVPHEPDDDPRIDWTMRLCRQVGRTDVLSIVYSPLKPSRVYDGPIFLERAIIGEYQTRTDRILTRIGGRISCRGPAARYLQRVEAKFGILAATEEKPGRLGRIKQAIKSVAVGIDHQVGSVLRCSGNAMILRTLVSTLRRRSRAISIPPRVIVCHDIFALIPAIELKRRFGCPVIYDCHEYWPEADLMAQRWECRLWEAFERRYIRQADLVVTVSPPLAQQLRETYGLSNVVSVPNAVPRQVPKNPSHKRPLGKPIRFLHQGRVCPNRGIEDMLEGWSRVTAPNVRLAMRCISNPFLESMKVRFASLVDAGRLEFLDPVPSNALVDGASEADVGVIPYPLRGINHICCCPNKLSEYMQAGLAILGTASKFVSQVVADSQCGEVFDPNDLFALNRAVDRLVSDPNRVQACKENAFRYAGDVYNWEVQSKPYLEAIARFYHDDAAILKIPNSTTQRRERVA
jgi:glycosyltransferase involved in cell wall biosynthesis